MNLFNCQRIKNILRVPLIIFKAAILYVYNYWLTFFPIFLIRKLYLRHILRIKIGKQTFIHMGCIFYPNSIAIGNNSVIGRECHLLGNIIIKDNVSITAQTYIFTASHEKNSSSFDLFNTQVVIEDYAWIGARAMILPGVRVGKGAILGAASTATKDISDYAICVGVPAKQVGIRSQGLSYKLTYSPYFQ